MLQRPFMTRGVDSWAVFVSTGLQQDGRLKVRVEPGLFEWTKWVSGNSLPAWIPPTELAAANFSIDTTYRWDTTSSNKFNIYEYINVLLLWSTELNWAAQNCWLNPLIISPKNWNKSMKYCLKNLWRQFLSLPIDLPTVCFVWLFILLYHKVM